MKPAGAPDPIGAADLAGARALVTGAAGAIGRRIAHDLRRAGALVHGCDRTMPAAPDEDFEAFAAIDLATPGTVSPALDRSMPAGPFDVLVNCAGVRDVAPLDRVGLDAWQRALDVNLTGTFLASQWCAGRARAAGRAMAITNIASTAGLVGIPDRAAYVAAKHGVVGLTKQMAVELAPAGIRVNAVAPGVIRTPMTEAYFDDADVVARLRLSHPLGLVGTVEDVSAAVVFLSSDKARYVTGAVLCVDGGFAAGRPIS